jgi:hypothetical protein
MRMRFQTVSGGKNESDILRLRAIRIPKDLGTLGVEMARQVSRHELETPEDGFQLSMRFVAARELLVRFA